MIIILLFFTSFLSAGSDSAIPDKKEIQIISLYEQALTPDTIPITERDVVEVRHWFAKQEGLSGRNFRVESATKRVRKSAKKTFVVNYCQDSIAAGIMKNFGEGCYQDSTIFMLDFRDNHLFIFNEVRDEEPHNLSHMIFVEMYDSTLFLECRAVFLSQVDISIWQKHIEMTKNVDAFRSTKPHRRPEDTTLYTSNFTVRYRTEHTIYSAKKPVYRKTPLLKDCTINELRSLFQEAIKEGRENLEFRPANFFGKL